MTPIRALDGVIASGGKRLRGGSKSLDNIQALRAVAAIAVICCHIDATNVGSFGVDIFFVISGFVIAHTGHADRAEPFILKRLFRIVPLYWLGTFAVFAVALVAPRLLKDTSANLSELVRSLFFIPFVKGGAAMQPVLFLGWTLNCEMLFYSIFAACLAVSRRHVIALATGAICLLVLAGAVLHFQSLVLQFWTRPKFLEFAAGLWLYVAWRDGRLIACPPWLALAGTAALLAFMTWCAVEQVDLPYYLAFGLPALMIVTLALSSEGGIAVPAVILAIGDASYSLYLFHPYIVIPAQQLVRHFSHSPIVMGIAIPLMFAAAIAAALISYRAIERPSNRWLRRRFLAADVKDPALDAVSA